MDSPLLTILLVAWLVLGFAVAILFGRAMKQQPPTPHPQVAAPDPVVMEFMRLLDAAGERQGQMYREMAEALRVALAPPAPSSEPAVTGRVFADDEPDVDPLDNVDPTDWYMDGPPPEGRVIGRDELEPFGIPGLVAPPMVLDDLPRLPPIGTRDATWTEMTDASR